MIMEPASADLFLALFGRPYDAVNAVLQGNSVADLVRVHRFSNYFGRPPQPKYVCVLVACVGRLVKS